MKLLDAVAWSRLRTHHHGVLGTLHASRGPDLIPVVYAASDRHVGVPIDRVKPKAASRLQREHNLEGDARAALLVEHWDAADWSRLWWVRAELHHVPEPSPALIEELAARLATNVPQYAEHPFHRIQVLRVVAVTGWAAAG